MSQYSVVCHSALDEELPALLMFKQLKSLFSYLLLDSNTQH